MPRTSLSRTSARPSSHKLATILTGIFFAVLIIGGGASRAEVPGQLLVRTASWGVIAIAAFLIEDDHVRRLRGPWIILAAVIAAIIVHLIPLPPAVWTAFPGRELFAVTTESLGERLPWRSLTLSPSATVNALSSMIVPVAALSLACIMGPAHLRRLIFPLISVIGIAAVWGLAQYSGADIVTPLVNHVPGDVSGPFANRNHLALFLAFGCVLVPLWVFESGGSSRRRMAALGLIPLLVLVALSTGSRSGLAITFASLVLGIFIARRQLGGLHTRLGILRTRLLLVGIVMAIAAILILSLARGRAVALERLITLDASDDLRFNALPNVINTTRRVFPIGGGFGAFDPVFRIWEPESSLGLSYLNHAHNDFLELLMDGGLLSIVVLGLGLGWWLLASMSAWRRKGSEATLAQAGSAIIFLVMLASVTDYPARVPMIMAVLSIGAAWLACGSSIAEMGKRKVPTS